MKKKKKRKIKFGGVLVIILFIYLIGTVLYCLWKMTIKSIDISGNNHLKDNYIINYLNINDKSYFKINSNKVKKNLENMPLINKAKVRKSILGKIYITIDENKVLFYNNSTGKLVLSNGDTTLFDENYLGVPTLINYVPDSVYEELISKLKGIDDDVISLISEIEYSPSQVGDKVVDEYRFIFKMNDGNKVYINTINIEKFNNYLEIYEALVSKNGNKIGCLYLDSNSDSHYFNDCNNTTLVSEEEEVSE